ncbi:MAG: RNA methyltransferase [Candidatus Eremiobacterota bacterium]
MITSHDNPRIKFLKSLLTTQGRKKNKSFIIEGFKLFQEALNSGSQIECFFYSPAALEGREGLFLTDIIEKKNINSCLISDSIMNSLCDTVSPRGLVAVIKKEINYTEEIDFSDHIWLMAYEIQDPGNLGTIIRTADAAGVKGIFLSTGTVDVTNPKVIRATMGSFFHTGLFKIKDIESFMLQSRKKGVTFITTSVSSGKEYFNIKYRTPVVLIAGNEGHGLPDDIIHQSDITVTIPVYGKAESLNVGIATGIILYEIARQKHCNSEK